MDSANFKTLCERLSQSLQREDVNIKPYRSEALASFNSLEPAQKERAFKTLRDYVDICEGAQKEHISLRDSERFCRKALERWGLSPSSDFFIGVENGDCVEVYTEEGFQVFRNLRFFELSSYTVEELYCIEWWKLFGRNPGLTEKLFSMCLQTLQGRTPGTLVFDMPEHDVWESVSAEKRHFMVQPKFGSALHREGRILGFLVANRVRPQKT
ncbi:hypothetical protein [Bdellovibrio bacteriovorus]|uniref:Uncharacterized protein n=1 Tax=Bdellovibrio bacteriovorus str. Tiberius TaxID=1069642 RepID=K7ZB24_BDEBC|nr:hypothetical protein [Bdellovibrio bacteriovorus]AFY02054.1 hypothetical protein Bdt_2371 [Bdellovibrio bacteriovorus str. Tiberius]